MGPVLAAPALRPPDSPRVLAECELPPLIRPETASPIETFVKGLHEAPDSRG